MSAAPESTTGTRRARLTSAVKVALGAVPITAAAISLAFVRPGTSREYLVALLLFVGYVVGFRTMFESERGSAVPTQPVLVAMLLCLPTPWVAPLVLLAVIAGSFGPPPPSVRLWQYVLLLARSAWNCVAPVCAVLLLHTLAPDLPRSQLVATAVAAQLFWDALQVVAVGYVDDELDHFLRLLPWMLAVDATLAVIGYCIVVGTDGELPWLALLVAPIALVRLLAHDREQVFEQAQTFNQQARRDPMTGLLNRRGWEETVLETQQRLDLDGGRRIATVLAADLDRLKFANDTFGHQAGDALICGFAALLAEALPRGAAVARLGGDEYAALVLTPAGQAAPDLPSLVRAALASAPDVAPVRISASLGQAVSPPARDIETAMAAADHAARVDKESRRMTREETAGAPVVLDVAAAARRSDIGTVAPIGPVAPTSELDGTQASDRPHVETGVERRVG